MNISEVRILLVDDHQMVRQGLRQLIASQPGLMVVGEAFCSQSAMEEVRISAPHLVVMDMHLPGESGVEITRRLRVEFPEVKVLALSGDSELELVFQALHAGVSGYVLKENGPDELFKAIHAVMDNRLHLSPEVASAVIKNFMNRPGGGKFARTELALSDRERLLLRLVADGKRNTDIGGEMALTAKSVETYRSRLMKKLGCASTIEMVRLAIREEIIQA